VTDYPNAEHEKADKAARRRALQNLDLINDQVARVRQRVQEDVDIDADILQAMTDAMRALTGHVAEIGTLFGVRAWDKAAKQGEEGTRG
jgi:hypothetical protein